MTWLVNSSSYRFSLLVVFGLIAGLISSQNESTSDITQPRLGEGRSPSHATLSTPGVTPTEILFGQSAALTGEARALGSNFRAGLLAAFEEANDDGGIFQRRLKLISQDDAYFVERSVVNTRNMIEVDGIFAMIGSVGTPTSQGILPILQDAGVPMIAPYTGAAFLRDPDSGVINYRSSYAQEAEVMVDYFYNRLGIDDISVFYQEDSFGMAGYQGVLAALEKRNLEPAGTGVYPHNTIAVKTALLDIRKGNPRGIILVGAYRPSARFISWAKYLGMRAEFIAISFTGAEALSQELGRWAPGVYVTQTVPVPTETGMRIQRQYQAAMKKYQADIALGYVSFEAYIAARMTIELLRQIGPDLTREKLQSIIDSGVEMNIGGLRLDFGPQDNQGSDEVFLTRIQQSGELRSVRY